jgi:hypothetical protein
LIYFAALKKAESAHAGEKESAGIAGYLPHISSFFLLV